MSAPLHFHLDFAGASFFGELDPVNSQAEVGMIPLLLFLSVGGPVWRGVRLIRAPLFRVYVLCPLFFGNSHFRALASGPLRLEMFS